MRGIRPATWGRLHETAVSQEKGKEVKELCAQKSNENEAQNWTAGGESK